MSIKRCLQKSHWIDEYLTIKMKDENGGKTMYKQIYVGVDGSESSDEALKKASYFSRQFNVSLSIVNVVDTRNFTLSGTDTTKIWEMLEDDAKNLLESSKNEAENLGVKDVRTELLIGNPRSEIPNKLDEKHTADLLILGGSGRNAVSRFLVGSVTDAAVHRTKTDVLTVKNESSTPEYEHILVAVDGSTQAEMALNQAIKLAETYNSALTIAHVIEFHPNSQTYELVAMQRKMIQEGDLDIQDEAKEEREMLEKYQALATEKGVQDVRTILHYGNPRKEIPRTLVEQNEIDLLVTAATGRGAVERFFVGSVAYASIHHAPCDILTVKN